MKFVFKVTQAGSTQAIGISCSNKTSFFYGQCNGSALTQTNRAGLTFKAAMTTGTKSLFMFTHAAM